MATNKSEQAQIRGQFPQVPVCDKTLKSVDLQAIFWKKRRLHVHRINIDMFIPLQHEGEIDRSPADQNQVDFRMWNSACLDYVFDGRALFKSSNDWPFSVTLEKEIEIASEGKLNGE